MMKIAFFTQNLANYISGGRQYPWHMAHCLARAGHQIVIITDANQGDVLFDRDYKSFQGRNNITFIYDRYYGTKDNKLMNIIKSCDLFMTSPMNSTDYGVALAKNFKKKVICLVYEPCNLIDEAQRDGIPMPDLEDQVIMDFTKQVYVSDMILCNAQIMVDHTKRWLASRIIQGGYRDHMNRDKSYNKMLPSYSGQIEHLYNGFNTDIADTIPFVEPKDRENSIVYLSRTQQYKGFVDLLIFGQTKTKPKIHFISGFIDMKQPIVKKFFDHCKNFNIDVVLHNRISEAEKFSIISRAKFLFHPSRFEGFGIPPAEAFYCKTPVICYDLPVLKEVYKEYPHYMPSFQIEGQEGFLDELLNDTKFLFRGIEQAKEYVKSFASNENYTYKINEVVSKFMKVPYDKKEIKPIPIIATILEASKEADKIIAEKQIKVPVKEVHYTDLENLYHIPQCKCVVIHEKDITFGPEFEKEMLFRFEEQSCDLMTFNYRTADKEINLPNNDVEMLFMRPKCLGGVVAFRTGRVFVDDPEEEELDKEFWELDLRLRFDDHKWYHCNKPRLFKRGEIQAFNLKPAKRMIRHYLEDKDLDDHFEPEIAGTNMDLDCYPTKITDKALVIIPCRTNRFLPKLMSSIERQCNRELFDTVLCYHDPEGKHKDSDEVIGTYEKHGGKKWVKVSGPFNFSKMNNDAFKEFGNNYQYVILCNDDIVLDADTLSCLLLGFKYKWKDIGIVGAKLLYPEGENYEFEVNWFNDKHKIQHAGVKLLRDKRCQHMFHKYAANRLCANYIRKVDAVTFGLVAIDTECYESILLKENYPNDLNDIDFCIRASQKGWGILYNPLAVAYHLETATRKLAGLTDDYAGRQQFKKDHKEILEKQCTVVQMYDYQRYLV